MNGDGKLDVVWSNGMKYSHSVSLLLGAGDGTFNCTLLYPVAGTGKMSIGHGDLNADKRLDLVATGADPGLMSVLLNLPL